VSANATTHGVPHWAATTKPKRTGASRRRRNHDPGLTKRYGETLAFDALESCNPARDGRIYVKRCHISRQYAHGGQALAMPLHWEELSDRTYVPDR
jgi:hypothetical protein